jgi:hypothetical protein
MPSLDSKDNGLKYRVFISYSRRDAGVIAAIVRVLRENGLEPMWDKDFAFGQGFHEQIKNFIAHSHVFLPVISRTSEPRRWVHQEIGYAMAMNIPVLPIAYGRLPGEMLQQIHAIQLDNDPEACKQYLSKEAIANLVQKHSSKQLAFHQCAEFSDDRAAMMTQHARDVELLGVHAMVRQKGGLSSFHIPSNAITHPVWRERYGDIDRGQKHCSLQLEERRALERHASQAGCKLIVNPKMEFVKFGPAARLVRLKCLLEFLKSKGGARCQIAFHREMEHHESVTILGDWFVAEAVSARVGQGYVATIFTKHAPSMLGKIEMFDQEFTDRLKSCGWTPRNCRSRAIGEIEGVVADLQRNLARTQSRKRSVLPRSSGRSLARMQVPTTS